ncbi:hypothetical protein [Yoonia sp. 2307UL14-13]|uniref:hypothetical protein n=1 Tax=Yoonia sp. 2307UL14-13 TaxID=3126506 RepID=UPI0030A5B08A
MRDDNHPPMKLKLKEPRRLWLCLLFLFGGPLNAGILIFSTGMMDTFLLGRPSDYIAVFVIPSTLLAGLTVWRLSNHETYLASDVVAIVILAWFFVALTAPLTITLAQVLISPELNDATLDEIGAVILFVAFFGLITGLWPYTAIKVAAPAVSVMLLLIILVSVEAKPSVSSETNQRN